MKIKVIYENENLLVVDKPARIITFPEKKIAEKTLIDYLLEKFPVLKNTGTPPRYGIVHRLDKDTSGILLIAKNNEMLNFLKEEFKERK
ncbi:MAG: pseudouridine synthase, partial [Patescibacteria group bacterium]|nr:pseudouridine synthase [Patescibacteria group bacterium]